MKRMSDQDDLTASSFTIKSSLRSFCRIPELIVNINQDVDEMSDFAVETSIYIHYIFNRMLCDGKEFTEKPNFLQYFYHLKDKSKRKYEIDPEYRRLRESAGLTKYNGYYRSNLFCATAQLYETVTSNNIWMHAYSRIKRFFKITHPDIKSNGTLDYLFNRKSKHVPDPILLQDLEKHLAYKGHFFDIKFKWYRFIAVMYRLQRFFESNNVRNFRLFPIFKHGRKHIRYDTFAFFQLLASCGSIPKEFRKWAQFMEAKKELWSLFFNYKKFETVSHTYAFSFTTDGIVACLHMQRPSKVLPPPSIKRRKLPSPEKRNTAVKERLQSNQYDTIIGMDPGLRLLFGGVCKKGDSYSNLKLKSSLFRHDSGESLRKYQLHKWTYSMAEPIMKEMQDSDVPLSPMNIHFAEYTTFALRHLKQLQRLYKQRKIARLKFEKYICVEKTIHRYVEKILTNTEKRALIFIGDPNINRQVKGYVRTPIRKICQQLENMLHRCDVIRVDEFRTTKLCSRCFQPAHTSRSPDRFQVCRNCKVTWKRDVNAGNIMKVGMQLLLFEKLPQANFCRSVNASATSAPSPETSDVSRS